MTLTVIRNAGEAGRGKAKGAFFQIGFFTDPVYDKTLFLLHNSVCSLNTLCPDVFLLTAVRLIWDGSF